MLILTFIWRAPTLARLDGADFSGIEHLEEREEAAWARIVQFQSQWSGISREGGARRVLVSMYWVQMIRQSTDRFRHMTQVRVAWRPLSNVKRGEGSE